MRWCGGAWAQTIFYPLMQCSALGRGVSLLPLLSCDKFDTKHFCDVPVVDAAAVLGEDGSVTVFAVNRDLQEGAELALDLRSFGELRMLSHSVLHHDDMKAVNTEEKPHEVAPVDAPVSKPGEPVLLPAASWNVLRFGK